MATGSLPKDPIQRTLILPLESAEIDRCRYDQGTELLHDPECHILPLPPDLQDPFVRQLADSGVLRPGTVLVQNPYERDKYVPIGEAKLQIAIAKHMHMCEIAQSLGATLIRIDEVHIRRDALSDSFKLGAGIEQAKVSLELAKLMEERCKEMQESSGRFKGGDPDIGAAQELLVRYNLRGDEFLTNLVKMRSNRNNEIETFSRRLNLTKESANAFTVAGKLKLPAFLTASVDLSYKRDGQEKTELSISVHIDFRPHS